MKKLLSSFLIMTIFMSLSFTATATTIYLPTSTSTQYLPTVKIFSYTYSYDGDLIAEGYGSGTLIDSNGTILTNNHVIEDYWDPSDIYDVFQICLTKSNNTEEPICEFTASMIARDSSMDLAMLKMDSMDVRGNTLNFDFFLPYDNSAEYEIGDTITVVGYPDTGGKTITYTSGLISGLLTESGVRYIKTDADISFGNSGGTAVDENGNFIGVPTYIIGSYSSEVLGYLFPVEEAVSWIDMNKNDDPVTNEVAKDKLKKEIMSYISANETGYYKNDYPPYEISLIDGWKFGNELEGAFEGEYDYYSDSESVTIFPVERAENSQLYIEISVTDYPYNVSLDDIESYVGDFYYYDEDYELERVEFNGEYSAVKETSSYTDWWYTDGDTIYFEAYHIPYGNEVIAVSYSYSDSDMDRLDEVDDILDSFEVEMSAVKSKVVDIVESADPLITVKNPLSGVYLSDSSYEYDGESYFGATFGKKDDYDFYVGIYSDSYWDDAHIGDFDKFKEDTMADAESWADIITQGGVRIDGHEGFFYTEEYDYGYGDPTIYTDIYLEGDGDTYFVIYYYADEDSYRSNMDDFKLILRNIEFELEGKGQYFVPGFISGAGGGGTLSDIDNYIYEDSIRYLSGEGAFGDDAPGKFNPAGTMSREDFVVWAVRSLYGDVYDEFAEYEEAYNGCVSGCFVDFDYTSSDSVYIEFARSKGAIGASDHFSPDAQLSLVAGLKIMFNLYDMEVWDAPDFVPWYIPFLHKGYEYGAIPYGVNDVGYLLTRGEGVYIIDSVLWSVEDSYYYDDYLW